MQRPSVMNMDSNYNKIEGKAMLCKNHSLQRQKLIINQLKRISNTDEQKISLLMKSNLKK